MVSMVLQINMVIKLSVNKTKIMNWFVRYNLSIYSLLFLASGPKFPGLLRNGPLLGNFLPQSNRGF